MHTFKVLMLTLALAAGVTAASQAAPNEYNPHDGCTTKSAHGVWDCQ